MRSQLRRLRRLALVAMSAAAVLPATAHATHGTPDFLENGHTNTIPSTSGGTCNIDSACLYVENQNLGNGAWGIWGLHTSPSGDGPGVRGETRSVQSGALGVVGYVIPTNPGPLSTAVRGQNNGTGTDGYGVWGSQQGSGVGVFGSTYQGVGVWGRNTSALATPSQPAVRGETLCNHVDCIGVRGDSPSGYAVAGYSPGGTGVFGIHGLSVGTSPGIRVMTNSGSAGAEAIEGIVSTTSPGAGSSGVYGHNSGTGLDGYGVWGNHAGGGSGVYGTINSNAANSSGVKGLNTHPMCCGFGVGGFHNGQGIGVYGESLQGFAVSGFSPDNWSGYFQGSVRVVGNLQKNSGSFTIDHPLDPANKYLSHSFVESPDMMNVYNGNVRTDRRGFATVELPRYFGALNKDFRYQLTTIGQHSDAWVAREIANNRFTLRTEKPFVKVSWQVTGIRKDRWANAHRIKVEERKTGSEAGKYLNPELYGKPLTKSVVYLPGLRREAARTAGRAR